MKLMELLEQGKRAAREGMKLEYIELDADKIFTGSDGYLYRVSYSDLTRDDWYEYVEEPQYKTNFELHPHDEYYCESSINELAYFKWSCSSNDTKRLNNFNAFPSKELAEFIQKKQLLERKLMIFSYLNGADEIDWENAYSSKYVNAIYFNTDNNKICDDEVAWSIVNMLNTIYFKDKETCKAAYDLYIDEIEEVLRLKVKFGF